MVTLETFELWSNPNIVSEEASFFLAHLWCAYAIPPALSVVRRPSSVSSLATKLLEI